MDAIIIPPAPSLGEQGSEPVTSVTPSPVPTKTSTALTGIIIGVVLLLLTIGGVFGFYVLPRQNTVKRIEELTPNVALLRSSTLEVIADLKELYTMSTSKVSNPTKTNVETTGILIHPQIAVLTDSSRVLGATITKSNSTVTLEAMQTVAKQMKGTFRLLKAARSDVGGATTPAEDEYLSTYRTLKDKSVATSDSVSKGQAALHNLVTETTKLPVLLPSGVKSKLSVSTSLNLSAGGYLKEAQLMADYYKILCDTVISMNTEINSFRTAMTSAGMGFAAFLKTNSPAEARTTLSQVQVFLDQAKTDMSDLKKISQTLEGIPNESLPAASSEYHAHNKKILLVATDYFTTQIDILQNIVNGANDMVNKYEKNSMTAADRSAFSSIVTQGISRSDLSDAKFASDLQTLVGEEGTLTISFWQNNSRIADGDKVTQQIQDYQTGLEKMKRENTVGFH